jgi:hypothetical protein
MDDLVVVPVPAFVGSTPLEDISPEKFIAFKRARAVERGLIPEMVASIITRVDNLESASAVGAAKSADASRKIDELRPVVVALSKASKDAQPYYIVTSRLRDYIAEQMAAETTEVANHIKYLQVTREALIKRIALERAKRAKQ